MILGDFNADGVYITHKEMKEIRIRSDKNFHWLIGDDVDTTAVTSNEHTYDRHVCITFHSRKPRENCTYLSLINGLYLQQDCCVWRGHARSISAKLSQAIQFPQRV